MLKCVCVAFVAKNIFGFLEKMVIFTFFLQWWLRTLFSLCFHIINSHNLTIDIASYFIHKLDEKFSMTLCAHVNNGHRTECNANWAQKKNRVEKIQSRRHFFNDSWLLHRWYTVSMFCMTFCFQFLPKSFMCCVKAKWKLTRKSVAQKLTECNDNEKNSWKNGGNLWSTRDTEREISFSHFFFLSSTFHAGTKEYRPNISEKKTSRK